MPRRLKTAMVFRDPDTMEAVVVTPGEDIPDWAVPLVVDDDLVAADDDDTAGPPHRAPRKQPEK